MNKIVDESDVLLDRLLSAIGKGDIERFRASSHLKRNCRHRGLLFDASRTADISIVE